MKQVVTTLLCCLATVALFAKPAKREPIVYTEDDGTQTIVYQYGDEHFHWTTNAAGEWIAQDAKGQWQKTQALSEDEIQARRANSRYAKAENARQRKPAATQKASPTNIAHKGLIILVNFTDKQFQTSYEEMHAMFTSEDYSRSYTYKDPWYGPQDIIAKGSALKYFQDASFGQYSPEFDVVGPVTVSKGYAYYGANDYSGDDQAVPQMVKEACELADKEYGIDFSQYDNDKDGIVDYVYVVYAGYGEADSQIANTIWPHSFWLTADYINLVLDGVQIDTYACGNEISYSSKQHDGIGTFVHEFSHVLGLPDLYATNGASHRNMGTWDIMDYGPYNNDGNNPPTYSGYERFFFGWATPKLITDTAHIELHDLYTTNEVLLVSETDKHNLIGNDPNPATFYLIENRQPNIWDEHLLGHGMMLTKIQYDYKKWYNNSPNNSSKDLGVDLIEAKKNTSPTDDKPTDLFPAGATLYTGIAEHPIYDIQESKEGVISFNFLSNDIEMGWNDVENAAGNPIVGIYTLTGVQIPIGTTLSSGMYVVKREHSTEKIIVR